MAGTTLGTAYVQIVPSAQGIKGSITEALGGEAESAGKGLGGKVASFAKKAIIAAGIGAAAVKGMKAAFSEGAKLQQSYIGGVDTLYGEAAESVREHARAAAQYGLSMNDYSEQAVSFGAALKSAYGGDVVKAAEAADKAIQDMADNSAKMGTDINSVQMAYAGFAKQNYTMLDNLKLGYGGTKSEMERLLADAEKLSGVHYDINNLGDVYDAIHVIQGDLGLTGVAAAEASETFSGSFAAMQAAAQNFAGSLAIGEGVQESLSTLMTSMSTFFFDNFIPMLGTIISSLPGAIWTFISQGIPMLLGNISNLISSFASNIGSLADGLTGEKVAQWAKTTIPKILSAAGSVMGQFIVGLIKSLPKIVLAIGKIGLAIVKGLGSALWGKITAAANGIKERFMTPINALKDKVKGIIEKIKGFFHFNVPTPHIPKPVFSVTPAGWKVGDLLKGSIPHLSIKWAAKGGLVDGTTLIGAGEAGPEAILPLDPFWRKLEQMNNSQPNNVTINIYASEGMSVTELATEVERRLVNTVNRRRLAWQ